MANTTIVRVFKLCLLIILMVSTLFMSSLQARSLKGHVDSQRLLHELRVGKIKHDKGTRRSLEDWISPSGPDPKHDKHIHS
ncbi:CLAVATA3/ESR-related-ROOT SIGNAL 3 [Sesbania bispinosa]|nr:CLAVATA3/ESR-related-ROOT SIGNAL 3 [Sesbania bispinosa]